VPQLRARRRPSDPAPAAAEKKRWLAELADGEAQVVGPFLCFCIVLYFLPCFLPSSTAADSSVTRGACGPRGPSVQCTSGTATTHGGWRHGYALPSWSSWACPASRRTDTCALTL
jgi:hypothetical protein